MNIVTSHIIIAAAALLLSAQAAKADLFVADYESGSLSTDILGGSVTVLSGAGHDPVLSLSSSTHYGAASMQVWVNLLNGISPSGDWCAVLQKLDPDGAPRDLRGYESLNLSARGGNSSVVFLVELKDSGNKTAKVAINGLPGFDSEIYPLTMREYVFPLAMFSGVDLSSIVEVNYVWEYNKIGSVHFDNVRFVEGDGLSSVLLLADYESGSVSPNNMGGAVGPMSFDGGEDPFLAVVSSPVMSGTKSFSIDYLYTSGKWCGVWQRLNASETGVDVSAYKYFKMYARGAEYCNMFKVELEDSSGAKDVCSVTYLPGFEEGLSKEYRQLVFPLSIFEGVDLKKLKSVNYIFEWGITTGTVFIDSARFTGPLLPDTGRDTDLVVADLENGMVSFPVIGIMGTFSDGGTHNPELTNVTTPVRQGSRALKISYVNDSTSSWSVVWITHLGSASYSETLNVSAYSAVNFWAKGSAGGEIFEVELMDGLYNKASVNLSSLPGFENGLSSAAYREISVPLEYFSSAGVNIASLSDLSFYINGAVSGSIYLDDIRFVKAPDVVVTIPEDIIGVDVSGAVSLGELLSGCTGFSSSAVVVTNSGNTAETYLLSLTNPDGLQAGAEAGPGRFILNGAFDSAGGASVAWNAGNHMMTSVPAKCSNTRFAGDQYGVSVSSGGVRSLWFSFCAPTSSTGTFTIPISVSAVKAE